MLHLAEMLTWSLGNAVLQAADGSWCLLCFSVQWCCSSRLLHGRATHHLTSVKEKKYKNIKNWWSCCWPWTSFEFWIKHMTTQIKGLHSRGFPVMLLIESNVTQPSKANTPLIHTLILLLTWTKALWTKDQVSILHFKAKEDAYYVKWK